MKNILVAFTVATMIALTGCGNNNNDETQVNPPNNNQQENQAGMDHSNNAGEVPKGLKDAIDPTYKVGSQVIIKANHMEGMNGATATIVGAYDTTVYTVSYIPTTGGEKVTNHKWIIHEEIKDRRDKSYDSGEEVILEADHMQGMKGAKAVIDSAKQTTIYMVDYTPTTGGEIVKNHQWLTESELSTK
ncbi:MAG: YdhK family protein [Candidatus Pristimantibacillus sp.]